MDLFVFTTADGFDLAIPEDDIAMIWAAKDTPGNILIERITDNPAIEVVYDFDTFIKDFSEHVDLRPRAQKAKKRPTQKAKKRPAEPIANVIELAKRRGQKK